MARPRKTTPSYRKHSSGQAVVTLSDGMGRRKEVLLGEWNSPESRSKYDLVISRWIASGRKLDHLEPEEGISNNELYLRFLEYAEKSIPSRWRQSNDQSFQSSNLNRQRFIWRGTRA